jgi:hypothetical protein
MIELPSDVPDDRSFLSSRDFWNQAANALAPLWVVGLGVLCLAVGYFASPVLTPVFSRAGVWLPYLALGTLFPVLLAVVVVAQRVGYKAPGGLRLFILAITCSAVFAFAGPVHAFIAIGVAQLQTGICAVFRRRDSSRQRLDLLTLVVFSFLAWVVCLELFTWEGMASRVPPSWTLFAIGGTVAIATCWWMFGGVHSTASVTPLPNRLLDLLAIVVIAAAAFRTDGLFVTDGLGEDGTFHHWGAFIGAAAAVKQGGWLLWDVPSLYGFLSAITLARLPTPSTWESLYLVNGLLAALLGVWVYSQLKAVHATAFGSVFALLAVLVVVFLSTYPPLLSPQHYFPQSGAFRFVWCYVLIGVLAWESSLIRGSNRQRLALIVGSLCWTLSALWSAESAVYGTAIWLPAMGLMLIRDYLAQSVQRTWRTALGWFVLPPLFLTAMSTAIVLFYRSSLGEGPDIRAYFEVVLAFSSTTVSDITGLYDPMTFARTIAVGVLVVVMLAAVAVEFASKQDGLRYLPLACGSALGVWALLSYPVGEVFQFAIYRIVPFMILVMAVLLSVALPSLASHVAQPWTDAFKATFITILVALLTTAIANVAELGNYINAFRTEPFIGRDVTAGLPTVDPSLQALLVDAGVKRDDPIFYAGSDYGNLMPKWTPAGVPVPVTETRQWLTGQPVTMVFLSDPRKQVYMARDTQRYPEGGWLVERRQADSVLFGIGDWFFKQVSETHVPTRIAENEHWRLVRYEPAVAASGTDEFPGLPQGHPTLPAEFMVNGTPLSGSVFPSVWGYFGSEWSSLGKDEGGVCALEQGTLFVFTPAPLNASLAVSSLRGSDQGVLDVSVNGQARVSTQPTRNGKMAAEVALHEGWNEIVVALPGSSNVDGERTPDRTGCEPVGSQRMLAIKSVDLRFRT